MSAVESSRSSLRVVDEVRERRGGAAVALAGDVVGAFVLGHSFQLALWQAVATAGRPLSGRTH